MTTTVGQASRRLTRDWANRFPELSVWRSRWLVRRIGPLLQGVLLDRTSDPTIYCPTSHVHVLAWPSHGPVLALSRRLKSAFQGADEPISLRFHDQELDDAATRLREQSPLPLDRVPPLPEVLDAFRARALSYGPAYPAPGIIEIEGMVLLAGAAGEPATVEACLQFARSTSAPWDAASLQRMGRQPDWLDQLAARARDQEQLRRVVDAEVERHKLTKVKTVEMPTGGAQSSVLSG